MGLYSNTTQQKHYKQDNAKGGWNISPYIMEEMKNMFADNKDFYPTPENLINKMLNPQLETMFLTASEKYTFLSSSVVREMASYGADLTGLVPCEIIEDVKEKAKIWRR